MPHRRVLQVDHLELAPGGEGGRPAAPHLISSHWRLIPPLLLAGRVNITARVTTSSALLVIGADQTGGRDSDSVSQ